MRIRHEHKVTVNRPADWRFVAVKGNRKQHRDRAIEKRRWNLTSPRDRDSRELSELVAGLHSPETLRENLKAIQVLFATVDEPPVGELIKTGVLPVITGLLEDRFDADQEIQLEAVWILTNVAADNELAAAAVASESTVENLIRLLNSDAIELRGQCLWALGNLVSENCLAHVASAMLGSKAIEALGRLVRDGGLPAAETLAWTLHNICLAVTVPLEQLGAVLELLAMLMYKSADADVLSQALWALVRITENDRAEKIGEILARGLHWRVVELLSHKFSIVQWPASRVIGNLVCLNVEATDCVLLCGVIQPIREILETRRTEPIIRRYLLWSLCNITSGPRQHITAIIGGQLVPAVVNSLATDDHDTAMDALSCLRNMIVGGSVDDVSAVLRSVPLHEVADRLSDIAAQPVVLDLIEAVLAAGTSAKRRQGLSGHPFIDLLEINGITSRLEELTMEGGAGGKRSQRLLDEYFAVDGSAYT